LVAYPQVVLARAPGPITHAFFAIATEAHDDDGLPHTLEHLIFLGSEMYPFKGVLDMAANRLFARGTNAWTATDHTAYTATHAGADGLLALLPVYADHVLFPTITAAGYTTEVHHITGEGADAGVVYCEMQARENSGYSRTAYTLDSLLFGPATECGYAAETGGRLANLRESCSHAKVVAYHKEMYRPSGVRLIVAGDVDPDALLAALEPVQARIRSKGAAFWPPAPARPWSTPAPPLAASASASIQFPSDDETTGIVRVAWLTFPFEEHYSRAALEVLLVYLTDTSVSELQRAFVECEPPLAGGVYPRTEEYNPGVAAIIFDSVPMAQLQNVCPTLTRVLADFASGASPLDEPRLASVLHRRRLDVLDAAESNPSDAVAGAAIPAFLYAPPGEDGAALRAALDALARIEQLEREPAPFWTSLAAKALVAAPRVDVVGAPSAALGRDMAAAEAARLAAQREALGAEKLAALQAALDAATEANNVPMPADALRAFPVPPVDAVRMHAVATLRSAAASPDQAEGALAAPPAALAAVAAEVASLPLPAQFDDVASAFVDITIALRTDALSAPQRALLPTFLALMFESPVRRNGTLVPHDAIVAELAVATLATHATLGFGGGRFSVGSFGAGAALVGARAEAGRYADSARLLCDCLLRGEASAERIRVQAAKALNAVPRVTRDGGACAAALLRRRIAAPRSSARAVAFMAQQRLLTRLLARLDTEPATVCAEFEALRAALLATPGGVILHVAGRLSDLAQPSLTAPWHDALLPGLAAASTNAVQPAALPGRVVSAAAALSPAAAQGGWARLLGNNAVESGFLSACAPGPAGWHNADVAPLMVATELLTQLEGPFWKQIRGLGLAYSYGISLQPEEGLIYFTLFKAAHVAKAYGTAAEIVRAFVAAPPDSPLFAVDAVENAISSAIFSVLNREATPATAGSQALLSYFRATGSGHNARPVAALRAVTPTGVSDALRRYVGPLFDPAQANAAVCVNPNKIDELVAEFKTAHGIAFDALVSLDEAFPEDADAEGTSGSDVGVDAAAVAACIKGGRDAEDGPPAEGCECPRCVRNVTQGPFSLPRGL
jgi:Zn-dependent M16 (insulinase) family peptidase